MGKLLQGSFHAVSFYGIQKSGSVGCALCAQLFRKLKDEFPQQDLDQSFRLSKYRLYYKLVEHLDDPDRLTLSFQLAAGSNCVDAASESSDRDIAETTSLHQFHVASYKSLANCLTIDGVHHKISGSSGDNDTWKLVIRWMAQCVNEHPECSPNDRPQKWYPTRLLDVGIQSSHASIDALIRLHVPQQQGTSGHYATVSHRWGSKVPLRLTSKSASYLKAGVRVGDLPKTFADAVKVAWKFEIRYIWIDSLCIFQDSEEEWRSESAKMGLVYKNSWLNIAAIDSQDCDSGCFFERDKALVEPVKIKLGQSEQEYFCIDNDLWLGGIDRSPLAKRAWFVQERLLSPRQIHFGSLQLYWECRQHAACETLPGGIMPFMFAKPGTAASQQMKRFAATLTRLSRGIRAPDFMKSPDLLSTDISSDHNSLEATALEIYTGWRHTAANYSKCALTFPRDKLIAISGVAKEMSKVINDQYLAGLWRSQLPTMLLWSAEPNGPSSNFRRQKLPTNQDDSWIRPRPLRAPTWSWASTDTAIAFLAPVARMEKDKVAVDILEAHIEPLAGDVHGEILNGYIRVSCMLYPATLQYSKGMTPPTPEVRIGNSIFQHGVFLDESPDGVGMGKNLHCMPIFFREWNETQKSPTQVRTLLLQPSGESKGHFERFGLFFSWGNRDLKIFQTPWRDDTNLEYEEALGGGRYIITIT